jgi:hypothetical protein
MSILEQTAPLLHPEVLAWNGSHLTEFLDAVYGDDFEQLDRMEKSLVELALGIETRCQLLIGIQQQCVIDSHPTNFETIIDFYLTDANLALRDMVSLRPPDAKCPVRDAISRSINHLRQSGGFRQALWKSEKRF